MFNEVSNVVGDVHVVEWLINKIGVKLKDNLMKEWVETMRLQNSKEEDYLSIAVGYILRNDVHLASIISNQNNFLSLKTIDQDYEIFETTQNRLFQILEIENIAENSELRKYDSEKRSLKLKITDGIKSYFAFEEEKLTIDRFLKPPSSFRSNNPNNETAKATITLDTLLNFKIIIRSGTIIRRNIIMLNDKNCKFLYDFGTLKLFLESKPIVSGSFSLGSILAGEINNEEDKIAEEINIEDFMQYFDEI